MYCRTQLLSININPPSKKKIEFLIAQKNRPQVLRTPQAKKAEMSKVNVGYGAKIVKLEILSIGQVICPKGQKFKIIWELNPSSCLSKQYFELHPLMSY